MHRYRVHTVSETEIDAANHPELSGADHLTKIEPQVLTGGTYLFDTVRQLSYLIRVTLQEQRCRNNEHHSAGTDNSVG